MLERWQYDISVLFQEYRITDSPSYAQHLLQNLYVFYDAQKVFA